MTDSLSVVPAPVPEPTSLRTIHCPALTCRHVAISRSLEAAYDAITDHVARVHGSLVQTT